MSTPTPPTVADRIRARLAEVEAEATTFQTSAEQQMAAYRAVINELQRLLPQLTTEESQ